MAKSDMTDEQIIEVVENVLCALEPWLLQLLLYNNSDEHMPEARTITAKALVAVLKDAFK